MKQDVSLGLKRNNRGVKILFDLGQTRLIQGLAIKWTTIGFSDYFIEFSNDRLHWQRVAYKNCFQEEKCFFPLEPQGTRYVRLWGQKWNNPGKISGLDTIEVFEFDKRQLVDAALEADCAIVVLGETPYGEGIGDVLHNGLQPDDVATLDVLKEVNIPIIAVLVSGRALVLDHHINKMNALVAAWLPGSEGSGVSDVLFGDYDFEGTLPVAWPGF